MMLDEPDTRTSLQLRVLRLLSALMRAGIEEVTIEDFHAFAFFAEVLAPVWGVGSPIGDVLKEADGPHYPALQREIDHLVGLGLVRIPHLSSDDRGGRWRLDVRFALDARRSEPILDLANSMPDEDMRSDDFLEQLAFSFAAIPDILRDDAAKVDAAWSAPETSEGRFIAMRGPLGAANYSTEAARHFQKFAPEGVSLSPAEQTSLYMSLMQRRARG